LADQSGQVCDCGCVHVCVCVCAHVCVCVDLICPVPLSCPSTPLPVWGAIGKLKWAGVWSCVCVCVCVCEVVCVCAREYVCKLLVHRANQTQEASTCRMAAWWGKAKYTTLLISFVVCVCVLFTAGWVQQSVKGIVCASLA